jgi:hypothetical protein
MAKLDFPNFQKYLSSFDFEHLFVDVLGWNRAPAERTWRNDASDPAGLHVFSRRMVAELGGVAVIQVVMDGGWPDEAQRMRVWKQVSQSHVENLIIFTDKRDAASQSQWYWVKRSKDEVSGKPKLTARRHEYFRGQPVDLFASKLQAMVVELSELDATGRLPVLEAARRIQSALDVDKTTKKFFTSYSQQHDQLLEQIEGIDDDRDRRWYASVILNRLMFVWFMQKKLFLDGGNADYLQTKLAESAKRGKDRFFGEFLNALFFEAFAKPENDRSKDAQQLTGIVPYLNGGLFLHHKLELDPDTHQPRVGTTLRIPDVAFDGVFKVFAAFTWHLDDTPGGDSDEINPDVLGYIFEKYINQKAFGAYYTRPEITGYLAERSIHALILERVYEPAMPELKLKEIKFDTVADLLARMDTRTALKLVNEVLPSITILDPAVGSGAFLVAALKTLINVYYAVVGRAELGASAELQNWLRHIQKDHPSVGYYIKRRIVTDNLHGVDIMEEACEIAKLRLFLAMVSSVRKVEDLEPLPNIDFNILPGNSLVGLMRVDEVEFNQTNTQLGLFSETKPRPFTELLSTKNRKLESYRHAAEVVGKEMNLRTLRDDIDTEMQLANGVMDELLRDQFEKLQVKFEEATWDAAKHTLGKPKKRPIETRDIQAQTPFHWGYVFDDIIQKRGGFDIILANPPWEVFKPQAKEFFAEYSKVVTKNKMTIKEFEKEQGTLLQNAEVREAWLAYESRFPHLSSWFRSAPEFKHQSAIVGGKKAGSDVNLYKLFVERSFHLLRPGGHCGIVIPSGIYTDLGTKGLRDLLFNHTQIQGLFCFENRKTIFEGVDSRFKFVVLTFEKVAALRLQALGEAKASAPPNDLLAGQAIEVVGGNAGTLTFPAAFMRLDVDELASFPEEGALWLDVELIKRLSPESHSVMEFKGEADILIAEKMLRFPLLGEQLQGVWNVGFSAEFHMTSDGKKLFKTEPSVGRLPLYEGKMIWQFDAAYDGPRYWVDEDDGRKALLGRRQDEAHCLDYQAYRLGFRDIARNTDTRTLICAMLPPVFHGNKLPTVKVFDQLGNRMVDDSTQLYLCGVWNSFIIDWMLRQKVNTTINFFYLHQLPIPRLGEQNTVFDAIAQRAARLTCTTPEFDDLAREMGLRDHRDGATDPAERARLRAEIDGLVAHLYGLAESEFAHVLGTFPLVAAPVKTAAQNAYRDVERGLIK